MTCLRISAVDAQTTDLDIGCSKGTMLVDWPATRGSRAAGVDGQLEFVVQEAEFYEPADPHDIAACIGADT